jgi:hypothetical protein
MKDGAFVRMKMLCLSCNRVGDAVAFALRQRLAANTCLQSLNLDDDLIGDTGACALGQGLKLNNRLQAGCQQERNTRRWRDGNCGGAATSNEMAQVGGAESFVQQNWKPRFMCARARIKMERPENSESQFRPNWRREGCGIGAGSAIQLQPAGA